MKAQRQDAVRTRKSLLAAANEVFAAKGFRNATVAEISRRAGTNIAAINYHFGDKETLYREAWRHYFRESNRIHPPDGGVSDDAPPEERLRGQINSLLRRVTDEGNKEYHTAYMEMANPTGLLEEVSREELRPLRLRFASLVREFVGPHAAESQVRFCAHTILSSCIMPMFVNRIEPHDAATNGDSWRIDNIETYADHVIHFALGGLKAIRQLIEGRAESNV